MQFEQLEERALLSSGQHQEYDQVAPAWFAAVPAFSESSALAEALASEMGPAPEAAQRSPDPAGLRWIIRMTPEAVADVSSVAQTAALLNQGGVTFQVLCGLGLPGQVLAQTPTDSQPAAEAALRANPAIASFERDVTVQSQLTANDPQFARQSALHNTGQDGGTADADIDAPEAWNVTTGSRSVVVAVVDTGVDYTHPDLAANIWTNPGEIPGNGLDDDHNGFVDDVHGYDFRNNDGDPMDDNRHGTHVAGTIAAVGNNGWGVSGVAWSASVMPLKFLGADNRGQLVDAVRAINYATMLRQQYGVNVRAINTSWGSGDYSTSLRDALAAAAQADILVVAAAGNGDVLGRGMDNDQTAFYPASYDLGNIVAVAASDMNDKLARFSNYGVRTVDLAAPGVGILSTEPGGSYASRNGTSMAAPHVTGAAVLLFSKVSTATSLEVRQALLQSTDAKADFTGKLATGGRLNAQGALATDTFAPRAALESAPSILTPGDAFQTITVTYTDDSAVDVGTLDGYDLLISRTNHPGEVYPATFVSVNESGNGPLRTASYRMAAPGGTWGTLDNGEYRIELQARQVADPRGNFVRPQWLGSFRCEVTSDGVFTVNATGDYVDENPGDGKVDDGLGHAALRGAVLEANAQFGPATIVLPAGLYALTLPGVEEDDGCTGDLDVYGQITLLGAGVDTTIIDALWLDRAFDVHPDAALTLSNVTLIGGNVSEADGGGVRNRGTLTLDRVKVTENSAGGVFGADGPEVRANTATAETQQFADVAVDATGTRVVVWESRGATQSTYWFQRYASDGTPQGSATQIGSAVTLPPSSTWRPLSVAMAPNGYFTVAWTGSGTLLDIFAERFKPDGTVDVAPFTVNTYKTGDQVAPAVAVDATGAFVIAWQDEANRNGNASDVYIQRYRANGSKAGAETRVNGFTAGDQRSVDVAVDADGDFVVTWESQNQGETGWGVYARQGNVGNTTLLSEILVNTTTAGDQRFPSVAKDAAGRFVVAWQSQLQDGDDWGLVARRFDAAAVPLSGEFPVNTTTSGAQTNPSLAVDADGNFVVAWSSMGQDGSGAGVYAQRFSSLGTRRGEEFSVNTVSSGDQWHPRVVVAADSSMVLTWDGSGLGDSTGVWTRRFAVHYQAHTGGGIDNVGMLTLTDTTVSANRSGGDGGGLHNSGTAAVSSSTVSANTAESTPTATITGNGGGIANDGTLTLTNVTLSSNTAAVQGGGLFNAVAVTTTMTNSTVTANSAQGVGGQTVLEPVGTEFRVNASTTGIQEVAASAIDAAGNYVVVWESTHEGQVSVFGQRFFADGTARGGEFRISDVSVDQRQDPSVAMNAVGDFVVVWHGWKADSSNWGINAKYYNADGTLRVDRFVVNEYQLGQQMGPNVAMDEEGNFVVAWRTLESDYQIKARRFDKFCNALSGDFLVNTDTPVEHGGPVVAVGRDGSFVITWRSSQDGDGYSVHAQRYAANGTSLGTEFRVNTITAGDQTSPSMAIAPDGDFVIAWSDSALDGNGYGVYAQRYASDGLPEGSQFRLNMHTTDNQTTAIVGFDANSNLYAFWTSYGQDGSNAGIYGQQFSRNGIRQGTEYRVNSTTTGDQWLNSETRLATNGQGDTVVVWSGAGPSDTAGIYGQRFVPVIHDGGGIYNSYGGTVKTQNTIIAGNTALHESPDVAGAFETDLGNMVGDLGNSAGFFEPTGSNKSEFRINTTTAGTQKFSDVAPLPDGGFVVVWQGNQTGEYLPYGQRFDPNGDPVGPEFLIGDRPLPNEPATGGEWWRPLSIASDALGNFVVAWQSDNADGDGWGIVARRYAAGGSPLGSWFIVNTVTAGGQIDPHVAMRSDGAFIVVWAGLDSTIHGQSFDLQGQPSGAEFIVNESGIGWRAQPTVAYDLLGNILVFWASDWSIIGRKLTSAGMPLGSSYELDESTIAVAKVCVPVVRRSQHGEFVVVWQAEQDVNGVGNHWVTMGQLLNKDGAPIGSSSRLNESEDGLATIPWVSFGPTGSFLWTASGSRDGDDDGVFAREFDATGRPIGSEFTVNSTIMVNQWAPRATTTEDGAYVVTWSGNGPGDNAGIFARKILPKSDIILGTTLPNLGPLADNGGSTRTHTLLPGSPAIDAGVSPGAPGADQRGLPRPQDGTGDNWAAVDIGAYEIYHGTIRGTVFQDTNGNGTRDAGEAGASGVAVFLDANGNALADAGESSTTTLVDDAATTTVNEAGTYVFANIAPGTYSVAMTVPAGWEVVAPLDGKQAVNLYAGQLRTGVDFAAQPRPGEIRGLVFNDLNRNQVQDTDDTGLAGWTVYLDADNDGLLDAGERSVLSDADGRYGFTDLAPATSYYLREVVKANWEQTYPTASNGSRWTLTLAAGQTIDNCLFGNYDLSTVGQNLDGTLQGRLYHDLDSDGVQDPGEGGLSSYTVYLDPDNDGQRDPDEPSVLTSLDNLSTSDDETGTYALTSLASGTYAVRLQMASGARQTTPLGNQLTSAAFGTGEGPHSVTLGDFDRNGQPDLAVANVVTNNVSLLLNTGGAVFGSAINIPVGYGASNVAAHDFDGDGQVDLAVANLYGGNVSLVKNRGSGVFDPPTNVAILGAPAALAAGDFDRDGDFDLAVADEMNDCVVIIKSQGGWAFSLQGTVPVGDGPSAIFAAHLNDDNGNGHLDAGDYLDVAVANFNSNNVSVLLGKGDGTFNAAVSYAAGKGGFSLVAGDLDRDGDQDLAVANVLGNNVSVLKNTGSGTFAAATPYPVGKGPSGVALADLEGDGDLDLVVTNGTSQDLSVLRNRGLGEFEPTEGFGVADFPDSLPLSVVTGDLNDDGVPDVAVANGEANNVSVLTNALVAGANRAAVLGTQTVTGLDFGIRINNQSPTLDPISDAASVSDTAGPQTVPLTGITAGADETQTLQATAASSNPALVATPGINYTSPNATGTLTWQPSVNQAGTAVITVTVRDAGPDAVLATSDDAVFSRLFTVTVTLSNQAPADVSLSSTNVTENLAIGTLVGSFTTTDAVAPAGPFTYTLVTGTGSVDNGSFTIVGDQLQTNAIFDYEAKSGYAIRVRTTDPGGLWYEKAFTITVADANLAPTGISLSNAVVAENQAAGTAVGTLATSDDEAPAGSFTYTLVTGTGSTDNGSFAIVGDQLQTNAIFDYEAQSACSVRVRTTDAGGLTYEDTFLLAVTNVNEPPVLAAVGGKSVVRGHVLTFTAKATDADLPADTLSFSLDAASSALGMMINPTTGDFSWTPAEALSAGGYTATVTVTDNGDPTLSDVETLTISVYVNWQNPQLACDVNGDGRVIPLDVLILINEINVSDSRDLATTQPPTPAGPPFLDPNGDTWLTASDVLLVIDYINSDEPGSSGGGAGGEGEQVGRLDVYVLALTSEEDTATTVLSDYRQSAGRGASSAAESADPIIPGKPANVRPETATFVRGGRPHGARDQASPKPGIGPWKKPAATLPYASQQFELEDAISLLAGDIAGD